MLRTETDPFNFRADLLEITFLGITQTNLNEIIRKQIITEELPQQQTLIAKETKPDGESMKDTRQGVHIQIDVAAKALFGVLL